METGIGCNRRRVVLVGAGHAHLYTLARTRKLVDDGIHVTLVAPGPFWYSGLATGMVGGRYPPELDRIDVEALVTRGGGRFVEGVVEGLDRSAQTVHLRNGGSIAYDALSLNVGSGVDPDAIPGTREHAFPVKPIPQLWSLRQAVERRLRGGRAEEVPPEDAPPEDALPEDAQADRAPTASAPASGPLRVAVVGGGASAVELAANLRRLVERRGGAAEIRLLARSDRLLPRSPRSAGRKAARHLRRRGVDVRFRAEVTRIVEGGVATEAEGVVAADIVVVAPGLRPSPLPAAAGLPVDGEGAMIVDRRLRSVADPRIFGAGDCVALEEGPLPKVGVYAIRQAPVLYHNLRVTALGGSLRDFEPQRRFLLILNLGDGVGLATWGPFSWLGRPPFWLKSWIDRRFLERYRMGDG